MNNLETICQFLKEAQTYYLATVEGNQPRVRPFGTAHIYEGKLYFQTGLKKNVAQQLAANPKVEICAFMKGQWLRVSGEAVHDERIEAQQNLLNEYPSLEKMYQAGDGNTAVYYLAHGHAVLSSFTGEPQEMDF